MNKAAPTSPAPDADAAAKELRDVDREYEAWCEQAIGLHHSELTPNTRYAYCAGHRSGSSRAQVEAQQNFARRLVRVQQEALEIIAGKRQCADNLMGNVDIALAALAEYAALAREMEPP